MIYEDEKTLWWILQIQLPKRHGKQLDLFSDPMPRPELLRKSFSVIPESIRISRGSNNWGFADLSKITNDLFSFYLTVRPPYARIAEEPQPGHLQESKEPRFYTLCVVNIAKQVVMVHKTSDVSRYARSARTFADIFQELLESAIKHCDMVHHYTVEVDPIAKTGSFIEWVNSIDYLKKIIIKHTGPNLPSGASNLITSIKDVAKKYQQSLKSRDVELVANEPELDDEEIVEIDKAVSDRRLKLRARGVKSGVGTTWSSSKKPRPETAIMPISEEQLQNNEAVANRINIYLNEVYEDR